jgi:hypothetical protein
MDAFRQWGTIRIAEPSDSRLRYHLHGDVIRRDVERGESRKTDAGDSARENLQADFAYWNLNSTPGQPLQPPLQIERVKGTVETKVEHELRLTERGWQVLSKFKVTPVRTSVDRLELSIDPQLYDSDVGASAESLLVEEVVVDTPRRQATVKIQKQSRPFVLKWPGLYRLSDKEQQTGGHLKLELPRCLQTLDRGGQITTILPPEGWELASGESLAEDLRPGEREYTWRSDRAPFWAELAWRPYRPEFAVDSAADLRLTGQQGRVRHQFRLYWSRDPASQLRLDIPPALKNRVRLASKDARLQEDGTVLLAKPLEKDRSLTLEYSFPLLPPAGLELGTGHSERAFEVPLVGVEGATRSESKIRIWSESGIQPALINGPWEERPTEVVAGQESVPILVLRNPSPNASLRLQLTEVGGFRSPDILIDRALIQVQITPESFQNYRARFLVTRINTRHLDIDLPDLVVGTIPQVFLGGKQLPLQSAEGKGIRLSVEPDLFPKPVVWEVRYKVVPSGRNGNGVLQTTLYPPILQQAVFLGPVRWELAYPPGWLSFYQGGGLVSEQRWAWQGSLFTPQPAMSKAELDRWLTATAAAPVAPAESATPSENVEPSLVCQQVSPQPLLLLHVSRQMWLLACSLVFLVLGLALIVAPFPRVLLWVLATVLCLGGAAAGIYWPGLLMAVIYGCEPGVVVFAFILAIQWMLQQRYRRRVVFLPGFTRTKQGSSQVRPPTPSLRRGQGEGGTGAGDRSRLEPSTVDAPPLPPSGHPAEVKGQ